MSKKTKLEIISGIMLFVFMLFIVDMILGGHLTLSVLRQYDAVRLAAFADRISAADRIVVADYDSPITLTVQGDDLQQVIKAISSAKTDRPPFGLASSCSFMMKATFFKGTKVLGDIEMCSSLFLIHHRDPPYKAGTESVKSVLYSPLREAVAEARQKEREANADSIVP